MSRRIAVMTPILLAALTACGESRPPWADGAAVRNERPADAPPQDLSNLPARLVALHNRERAAVAAPALAWDSGLAVAAGSYAGELARRGRLAHAPAESRAGQGENLWMGTRGAYSLEEMAGSWAAEKGLFEPGLFPEVSESGHWQDVAHYTQMIWRGTARLGCAVRSSASADFLVCRYAPAGNVVGQRVP